MPVTQLVRYDAMRIAIREAHSVDEAKDIRDKAAALEAYARQANDMSLERQVHEIRVRAERRAGELVKEMPKARGAEGTGSNQYKKAELPSRGTSAPKPKTLKDHGISYDQSALWQKLAEVPEEEFEEALASPVSLPTAAHIVAAHEARINPPGPEVAPTDPHASWLWGRLRDLEREGVLDRDPVELCALMPKHMIATVQRLTPVVIEWLGRIPL
jgi:hypothetical protein